jgi:hypothetical protein
MHHAQLGVLCLDYELIEYDKLSFVWVRAILEYDNMKCGVGGLLSWGVTP